MKKQLSAHFSEAELSCRCGCGLCDIDPKLLAVLEDLRSAVGRPVRVHSGHRCHQHNRFIGGSPSSQHLLGKAADVSVTGVEPERLADLVTMLYPLHSVGVYGWGIHIDTREEARRWSVD